MSDFNDAEVFLECESCGIEDETVEERIDPVFLDSVVLLCDECFELAEQEAEDAEDDFDDDDDLV